MLALFKIWLSAGERWPEPHVSSVYHPPTDFPLFRGTTCTYLHTRGMVVRCPGSIPCQARAIPCGVDMFPSARLLRLPPTFQTYMLGVWAWACACSCSMLGQCDKPVSHLHPVITADRLSFQCPQVSFSLQVRGEVCQFDSNSLYSHTYLASKANSASFWLLGVLQEQREEKQLMFSQRCSLFEG